MSLMDDLARVRAAGGHSPLPDPTKIQGFGPDDPPVPPYIPRNEVQHDPDIPREWLENDIDSPEPEAPPSPLIPRRKPRPEAEQPTAGAMETAFSLMVADRLASWKSRNVTLTPEEEASIRAIVLRAIQREVLADLREVEPTDVPVARRRKAKLTMDDAALSLPPAAPFQPTAKRRPGRPKKGNPQ